MIKICCKASKFGCTRSVIFLICLLLLSSCAVYGTQFECKGGKGAKCTSVSGVNRMIDRGEIRDEEAINDTANFAKKTKAEQQATKHQSQINQKQASSNKINIQNKGKKSYQQNIDVWMPKTKDSEEKYLEVKNAR